MKFLCSFNIKFLFDNFENFLLDDFPLNENLDLVKHIYQIIFTVFM